MNAAIFDIVNNAPAREIMAGLKKIFATYAKELVSLADVLDIIAYRALLYCDSEPTEKSFSKCRRTHNASLIPNITRLFIQNEMPTEGSLHILRLIDATLISDGADCDHIDIAIELIKNPDLARRTVTVEQARQLFIEFRETMAALSREDFRKVAFDIPNGTPVRDDICTLARYGDAEINHHTDEDELISLFGVSK